MLLQLAPLVAEPNTGSTRNSIGIQRLLRPTHPQSLKLIRQIELKLSRGDALTGGARGGRTKHQINQKFDRHLEVTKANTPTKFEIDRTNRT